MRTRFLLLASSLIMGVGLLAGFGGFSERSSALQDHRGAGKFVSTVVPHKIGRFDYQMLWLRSAESDLSLGINIGDFKDSNFGTRIHDFETGPTEYSCYPDDVVYARHGATIDGAYAGYLAWRGHAGLADGDTSAFSVYERRAGDGFLTGYIEPEIIATMQEVRADMRITHTLSSGERFVRTRIDLTNRYPLPAHFYWVYQDGVFLNLPDQNQAGVVPVTDDSFAQYRIVENGRGKWAGSFHAAAGAASILFSPDASRLFVLPRYLGVKGFPITDCRSFGLECELGGNDRFVMQEHAELIDLLNRDGKTALPVVAEDSLKIHGIVLDAGLLAPGESRSLEYIRLAVHDAFDGDELRRRVSAVVDAW